MKNSTRGIGIIVFLLAAAASFFVLLPHGVTPPQADADKTVMVEIIHGDKGTKTVELHTDADYLGPALLAQDGLVRGENGAYGLYITEVDGEAALEAERTWWCITKGGVEVTTGADTTPIADGDHFELTLMTY